MEVEATADHDSAIALEKELRLRQKIFERLKKNGSVAAISWDHRYWTYQGRRILFLQLLDEAGDVLPNRTLENNRVELTGAAASIIRCYAIRQITRQNSEIRLIHILRAVRILAHVLGDSVDRWRNIRRRDLDAALKVILLISSNPSTRYNYANCIVQFMDYLRSIRHAGKRFLAHTDNWHHRLENPATLASNPTTQEFQAHSERKYVEGLGDAIAKLAYKIHQEFPSSSKLPAERYYKIRISALTFCIAQGLRIQEVRRLPKNALGLQDGVCFTRVYTAKGAIPVARPVSTVWEPHVKEAYEYLSQSCASARNLALDIEKRGFAFIDEAIMKYRQSNPLSSEILARLKSINRSPDEIALDTEMTSCFSISANYWTKRLSLRTHFVKLPEISNARLVNWINQRFENGDWNEFFGELQDGSTANLTRAQLGRYAGVPRSTVNKPRSKEVLDEFILLINESRLLDVFARKNKQLIAYVSDYVNSQWELLRMGLLPLNRGSTGVVSLDALKWDLQCRYKRYLERHFKENFSTSDKGNLNEAQVVSSRSFQQALPLSDHLIVVWENEFKDHRCKQFKGLIPRPLLHTDFYEFLSGESKFRTRVFERLNVLDENGIPYKFTPHQIRHWLTTAMFRSGVNEQALALWMGRSPQQNRNYDHRTAAERAQNAIDILMAAPTIDLPSSVLGEKVASWRKADIPVARQRELLERKLKVMEFTPWGSCDRSVTVNPCDRGHSCLKGFGGAKTCPHFHIDTSDEQARLAIATEKLKSEKTLELLDEQYWPLRSRIESAGVNAITVDQHRQHLKSVIAGCESALHAYETARSDAAKKIVSPGGTSNS